MVSKRAKQTTTKTTSIHRHHTKKKPYKQFSRRTRAVVPKNGTLAGHRICRRVKVWRGGSAKFLKVITGVENPTLQAIGGTTKAAKSLIKLNLAWWNLAAGWVTVTGTSWLGREIGRKSMKERAEQIEIIV